MGRTIDTKGGPLKRTIRDEPIFRVLILLSVLDDVELGLTVVGLADRANLERRRGEPGAATCTGADPEVAAGHAILFAVFTAHFDMQPVV
jgi:hypothetical protein